MIKVLIKMDGEDFKSIYASGHANYSAPGEKDIVCASVSTLVQAAIVGIDQYSGYNSFVQEKGNIGIVIGNKLSKKDRTAANIIMGTVVLSIQNIAASFPKHVEVEYQGVKNEKVNG